LQAANEFSLVVKITARTRQELVRTRLMIPDTRIISPSSCAADRKRYRRNSSSSPRSAPHISRTSPLSGHQVSNQKKRGSRLPPERIQRSAPLPLTHGQTPARPGP